MDREDRNFLAAAWAVVLLVYALEAWQSYTAETCTTDTECAAIDDHNGNPEPR
jgi:hypothetical protein